LWIDYKLDYNRLKKTLIPCNYINNRVRQAINSFMVLLTQTRRRLKMANPKIYLTKWQQRMVKDYLGVDARVMAPSVSDDTVQAYKAPLATTDFEKAILMYLTDAQMNQIKDEFNVRTPCHFIELSKSSTDIFA
jgi:hypothetical protein